jgi:hypothetical protein
MFRMLLLAVVVFIAGCASSGMVKAPNQALTNAPAEHAQVVFMRSSFVGSAISASVFEVTNGTPEFLGLVEDDTKIVVKATPGKHVYMVVSEAADFMEAEVVAGKTYYSVVTPRMGAWKARFSLWPVSTASGKEFSWDSKDVQKMVSKTVLVENSEKSTKWAQSNRNDIAEKYKEYWKVWQQKTTEDVKERTLTEQDGH